MHKYHPGFIAIMCTYCEFLTNACYILLCICVLAILNLRVLLHFHFILQLYLTEPFYICYNAYATRILSHILFLAFVFCVQTSEDPKRFLHDLVSQITLNDMDYNELFPL